MKLSSGYRLPRLRPWKQLLWWRQYSGCGVGCGGDGDDGDDDGCDCEARGCGGGEGGDAS